jgi:hypothetical protein
LPANARSTDFGSRLWASLQTNQKRGKQNSSGQAAACPPSSPFLFEKKPSRS